MSKSASDNRTCEKCGYVLSPFETDCPKCARLAAASLVSGKAKAQDSSAENTSGKGAAAHVPPEILGWNWGAFVLGPLWGIFHKTWIAFLMLVPCVGSVMAILLGVKGSEWSWRNRQFPGGIEEFNRVKRAWNIAALSVYLIWCLITPISYSRSQPGEPGALEGFLLSLLFAPIVIVVFIVLEKSIIRMAIATGGAFLILFTSIAIAMPALEAQVQRESGFAPGLLFFPVLGIVVFWVIVLAGLFIGKVISKWFGG